MNALKKLLVDLAGRWDDHGLVTEGVFQLSLSGPDTVSAHVEVKGGRATVHDGVHPAPIGVVALPGALLQRLAAEGESFDPRVLDRDAQLAIQFSGDTSFLTALMYLLRRPRPEAIRRIRAAEAHAARRPRLSQIPRIHRPPIGDVVDAMRSSTPLVATGVLDGWAVDGWSFDRLVAEHGHVPLVVTDPTRTLGSFVREMRGDGRAPHRYTGGCPLPAELGRVFEPPFFARDVFLPQLWMGVGDRGRATTLLHRDVSDGFLAQLLGTKRVVFYSPDQAPRVYPFKNYNSFQPCWVDPEAPDHDRFPLFRTAEPVEVTLGPGDVLLNPAGWFHCVYAPEPTLSISFITRGDRVHSVNAV